MSAVAIRVENLSKQYRIGARLERYATLRDRLAEALAAPFRRDGRRSPESDTIWALKDVSFEVQRGEVVGVIGRNGAGKSTLLKILSRITKPTSGRAQIHGRVGSLLEVGTGFHPELTGRENIYLNGAILGMKRAEIERKFDEIAAFAEVEKFIDTPVKHYSSGMYVRLAFAVAAHLEPEILLVDEVLAVGDVAFQKKCLGKIGDVAREGRTVLFVSHNMHVISQICQRAILIEHGEKIVDGQPSDTIAWYLNEYRNSLPGTRVDAWNIGMRPRLFFKQGWVNDKPLPAEVIVEAGKPVHFRILGDTGGQAVNHFRAGVHFATHDNFRIASYGTPWSSLGDDLRVAGQVLLTCHIDRLQFIPGQYHVSIGCSDPSGQIDFLENICILRILPNSEMRGKLVPTYGNHGFYLVESEWTIEQS